MLGQESRWHKIVARLAGAVRREGCPVVQQAGSYFQAVAFGWGGLGCCSSRTCCLRDWGCLAVGGSIVHPAPVVWTVQRNAHIA
eukprot:15139045-Alexandrium_andersonii.AAC.1